MINPFIIIVDKDGDVATHLSANSTIDYILEMVNIYDGSHQQDAPHSAWKYDENQFIQVKDIEIKSGKVIAAKSIKVENGKVIK